MLNEVELGENAIKYVKNELINGDAISKSLLKFTEFEQGAMRTFLPNDVIDKENLDFRDSVAKDYQAMYSATHKKVANFIAVFLSQHKNNLVVFETFASPNDTYLKNRKLPHFINQQRVYLFLTGKNFDEQKAGHLVSAARGYPCVGILTSIPFGKFIFSQQSIRNQLLEKLARRTKHIIIGAFDEDGFLYWSK